MKTGTQRSEHWQTRRGKAGGKRGFTLIELLVVIAIIAILAAILVPAVQRARDKGIQMFCASNLHQQGLGMQLYANTTGHYPGSYGRTSGGRTVAAWPTRIRAHLDYNNGVFFDPALPTFYRWQKTTAGRGGGATQQDVKDFGYEFVGELLLIRDGIPFSYGYNDWGTVNVSANNNGMGGDLWQFPPIAQEDVAAPSYMIAVACMPDSTIENIGWKFNIDPRNQTEWPSNAHNDGANVMFADGHVEWRLQSELINVDGGSEEAQAMNAMWNRDHRVH
jgi:prepilin-type N-terminal cleavage/methylation domain-containing protein/prepilin-type processing-associated H-X9-DG protein